MTRNVMNIESPISTWLGGSCWVPIAWRSSDSTMMIRVKLVIISRIAGASERTVIKMMICIADEKFSFCVRSGRLTGTQGSVRGLIDGPTGGVGAAGVDQKSGG